MLVEDVLTHFGPAAMSSFAFSSEQTAALAALIGCRSGAFGASEKACGSCGWTASYGLSCGRSSCPCCGWSRLSGKVESILSSLEPFDLSFVTLKIPDTLLDLALELRSTGKVHRIVLDRGIRSILDAAEAEASVVVGVFGVLQTAGDALSFHPHVHLLATKGGLSGGLWRPWEPSASIAGRFRKGVSRDLRKAVRRTVGRTKSWIDDRLQMIRRAEALDWSVDIRNVYGPGGLLRYLLAPLAAGPIGKNRIDRIEGEFVVLRSRDGGEIRLDGREFVRRFLLHVPPPRLRRLRRAGLFSPGSKSFHASALAAFDAFSGVRPDGPVVEPYRPTVEEASAPTRGVQVAIGVYAPGLLDRPDDSSVIEPLDDDDAEKVDPAPEDEARVEPDVAYGTSSSRTSRDGRRRSSSARSGLGPRRSRCPCCGTPVRTALRREPTGIGTVAAEASPSVPVSP